MLSRQHDMVRLRSNRSRSFGLLAVLGSYFRLRTTMAIVRRSCIQSGHAAAPLSATSSRHDSFLLGLRYDVDLTGRDDPVTRHLPRIATAPTV